jgi:hypothetical protein
VLVQATEICRPLVARVLAVGRAPGTSQAGRVAYVQELVRDQASGPVPPAETCKTSSICRAVASRAVEGHPRDLRARALEPV